MPATKKSNLRAAYVHRSERGAKKRVITAVLGVRPSLNVVYSVPSYVLDKKHLDSLIFDTCQLVKNVNVDINL